MTKVIVEKDLYGALLSSALMSQVRGEILHANASLVDITLRNVCCVGGGFPEIIVDYGGQILETYGRALRLVLDHPELRERVPALVIDGPPYFEDNQKCGYCDCAPGTLHKSFCRQGNGG